MSIVCIVGPTAGGKSGLAMLVAQKHSGEIICVDSQTIRKGLDVGTAKPTKQDQKLVRHHMLDIVEPYEEFTAAEFKRRAEVAIEDIQSRGKLPILVGGTGLYMDAILFNYEFNRKADERLRNELSKKTVAELQGIIAEKNLQMPENSKNPRHLIRTIESDGKQAKKRMQREDAIVIGIDPGKKLTKRIEARAVSMAKEGLVEEAMAVVDAYGEPPRHWDAIGYQIVLNTLAGNVKHEDIQDVLTQALIVAHRQYAKRQRAWFTRNKAITWFEQAEDAALYIEKHL